MNANQQLAKSLFPLSLAGVALLALSACGAQDLTVQRLGQNRCDAPKEFCDGRTTPDPETFSPAASHTFTITGASGAQSPASASFNVPNVLSDNRLRVRVTAGTADINTINVPTELAGQYTAFIANYSCVRYSVTALGRTVTTPVMSSSGARNAFCPQAPRSHVIDFSDRLQQPGRTGAIPVVVSGLATNAKCMMYNFCATQGMWGPGAAVCVPLVQAYGSANIACAGDVGGVQPAYINHSGTGEIEIEVNGTRL